MMKIKFKVFKLDEANKELVVIKGYSAKRRMPLSNREIMWIKKIAREDDTFFKPEHIKRLTMEVNIENR